MCKAASRGQSGAYTNSQNQNRIQFKTITSQDQKNIPEFINKRKCLFEALITENSLIMKQSLTVSPVLPVYYQSNEWAGIYGIREQDQEAWAAKRD